MPSKCFVCGKRPAEIDGWCAEDWNAKHELVRLPPKFEITKCARCERAKMAAKWQAWNINAFLREKAKIFGRIDRFDVEEKNGKFVVRATGLVERGIKPKTEEHVIAIKFDKVMCTECSRAAGGYYEATIQLRGEMPPGAMILFEREITKILEVDARAFWTAKELKEGIDIRIGNAGAANKLADMLKHRYKTEIKKSYQLVGRKDGRDIHRTVISIRFKEQFK